MQNGNHIFSTPEDYNTEYSHKTHLPEKDLKQYLQIFHYFNCVGNAESIYWSVNFLADHFV